jgi:hypothetical protein
VKDNSRINANVKSDSYLYGYSLAPLADEPYLYVLVVKYTLAKKLMSTLILSNSDDKSRISAVYKAQDFNRELIKELGYSDTEISDMVKQCHIDFLMLNPDNCPEPETRNSFLAGLITKLFRKIKGELPYA